jgi:hypothetical protein
MRVVTSELGSFRNRPGTVADSYAVPSRARQRAGYCTAWVEGFVIFLFVCQLALLIPNLGPMRLILRVATFGASLVLILPLFRYRQRYHPAILAASCIMLILSLALLHPWGNTIFAEVAQWGMYAAILAPLVWIPGARPTAATFRRVALLFWAFHTSSALLGVLQVYVPNKLEPPVSAVIKAKGAGYVESLKITLANGTQVFRPMGLTDQPGGASMAGLYAVLFGLGLLLTEKSVFLRIACAGGIMVGFFCLELAQVRSVLVMAVICVLAFSGLLLIRGDVRRFSWCLGIIGILVVGSFGWAVSMGGDTVTKRLSTFVNQPAGNVYQSTRGFFLEQTVKEFLPQYPFGAGLGRWGMMNQYFGDNSNPQSQSIWVEIQWTGWLLDGGVPLILAYCAALGAAFWMAWKISRERRRFDRLSLWAALLFAYNLAALAMTFDYPLFIGQSGLEFWLLNACLFAAYQNAKSSAEMEALS